MCHERWTFYKNLSVFGHIENLRMDNIALKTFTSNSGKISWWKFYNCLVCMNSQLITHARMQRWIWNLQLHLYQPIQLLNNKYWFMKSWGVRLTWLDCNHSESKWTLYRVVLAILINKLLKSNISAVFFFIPIQWEIHLKICQILFRLVYLWILSIFILLALLVNLEHGKLCLLFHCLPGSLIYNAQGSSYVIKLCWQKYAKSLKLLSPSPIEIACSNLSEAYSPLIFLQGYSCWTCF